MKTIYFHIKGLVQGVGFRPFVYRIALRYNMKGWVDNRNDGVHITVTDEYGKIQSFIKDIRLEAPMASKIVSIDEKVLNTELFNDFKIVKSKDISNEITEISPDICVCDECLADMKIQPNRLSYPFINCTNCGPRFTIIQDLPYDREKTTMKSFVMCESCKSEYTSILDRRFHAQPIACSVCGPEYTLYFEDKIEQNFEKIISITSNLIDNGKIVGIKGIGGFFIACDAKNNNAVSELRNRKHREGKPLAVMFRDIESAQQFVEISDIEKTSLLSWQRPIVLLKIKDNLAEKVANGLKTIGSLLPYMPFHYLLFDKLKTPAIVLTSGNVSDDPIITDNQTALEKLSGICDAIVTYNREIYNRTDDSVITFFNKEEKILRRSRGYVPSPINLNMSVDGIIATGAELVNCFCVGKNNQAFMSQHIGDLKNIETLNFYEESLERFKKLFRISPNYIVSDLHPDYLSTKYAINTGLKHIRVQHHHAHIASCMAEHNLDEKVIGVSFDGTGLGDDGNSWGSEFFVCDLLDYKRYTHFEYLPLPGGDKTSKESYRMGISYLYKTFGKDFTKLEIPFVKNLDKEKTKLILLAIDKKINVPLSSSSGRLFDAVAAIINLCTLSTFQAEAPMRLEAIIEQNSNEKYEYSFNDTISFNETIKGIVTDLINGVSTSIISAKFHNTIIDVILEVVSKISIEYKLNKVALSGGTFQNRYLTENLMNKLSSKKFDVYTQSKIPMNDGGIALGQLVIAAKKIKT
ncbi:MAG TPA: carbamoyltransferase HypF [Bacteroidales bacterium]|nr:MAG: carbamoyltransferase HypF [Bacteroidetes bacterium GWF2_33_38]OFY91230.1 MAG: carbamoyltransferase HypF [Bacteroidetes bacterium RIFOXYA2_FULL_33_7]HBF89219.1 carbamoyltransferase HypF [Bacteroidales bacterium]